MILLVFLTRLLQLLDLTPSFFLGKFDRLAGENSALVGLSGFLHGLVSCLRVDIHQHQGVSNEIRLDKLVKGSISTERWRMVNLQEIDLTVGIDHEIEAKNLKTHIIG